MTPAAIATLLRQFMDERRTSFITDADVESYLDLAYQKFRQVVCTIDPSPYVVRENISPTSAVYDYAAPPAGGTVRLGSTAVAGNVLDQIVDIFEIDADNLPVRRFQRVSDPSERTTTVNTYSLIGTALYFNTNVSGTTLSVHFVPVPTITWTGGSPTAFLDNLESFHDVIPLMAYSYYAIRDFAANPFLQQKLDAELSGLRGYLYRRAAHGAQYIGSPVHPY